MPPILLYFRDRNWLMLKGISIFNVFSRRMQQWFFSSFSDSGIIGSCSNSCRATDAKVKRKLHGFQLISTQETTNQLYILGGHDSPPFWIFFQVDVGITIDFPRFLQEVGVDCRESWRSCGFLLMPSPEVRSRRFRCRSPAAYLFVTGRVSFNKPAWQKLPYFWIFLVYLFTYIWGKTFGKIFWVFTFFNTLPFFLMHLDSTKNIQKKRSHHQMII